MTRSKIIHIASWNVNGIRACIKKGFWDWFDACGADIVCLQETKITEKDFLTLAEEHDLVPLHEVSTQTDLFSGSAGKKSKRTQPLYFAIAAAEKAGYSGVAILSKIKPKSVQIGLGAAEYDSEGRTIIADFDDFTVITTYVPNGGRELDRIPYKLAYSDFLLKFMQKLRKTQSNIIICGDMNVAHTEIDIKNPKSNANNSGFTPIEREWFSKFLKHKYIDTFRALHPDARDVYSWWSYRPGVREKNIGWRIDYFVITEEMRSHLKEASVEMKQNGSDHCPIHLKIKLL